MKVFVTGGTGFVGSHVLKAIADRGLEAKALRRKGSRPRITLSRPPAWVEKPMDALEAEDLRDCDCVAHFASTGVSPQVATWEELFYWNVSAAIRLLDIANQAGIRKFVICGTCAEYGRTADRYDLIPPEAPLEPILPYAASKAAFFLACHSFCINKGVELAYYRLFSAYGEGQHENNFWPSLHRAAVAGQDFLMTTGDQVRDFIPVEEAAEAFGQAITSSPAKPGIPLIKNIASGRPVELRTFAEYWWRKWNATGQLRFGALAYPEREIMRYAGLVD